jgi:integrase
MASVYRRGSKWYLKVKTASGRWVAQVSTAQNKTEAKRLAGDLERRYERERLGLEVLPAVGGSETLDSLLKWWLETHSAGKPSHEKNASTVKRHLIGSDLGALNLPEVTAARVEVFLQRAERHLGPQTVNHLRGFVSRAFSAARRAGRFMGANPVAGVRKRKIPRSLPDYLRAHEVAPVLAAVPAHWRPFFATAIYTGLRKGELIGLRKVDVDLVGSLLTVAHSYDRLTTKGGHTDAIPIARDLVPYLEDALAALPTSELVFPRADGTMMPASVQPEKVLRRALKRAGIVTGYHHVCRRKGCGYREAAPDADLRRCPKHNRKLWAVAECRPIRFHDLRHTTASLLLMAGASPAAVQRILRHGDPRITMGTYGHLAPDYLRTEIDRLSFGPPPSRSDDRARAAATAGSAPLVTSLVQGDSIRSEEPIGADAGAQALSALGAERDTGLEPATFSLGRRSLHVTRRNGP